MSSTSTSKAVTAIDSVVLGPESFTGFESPRETMDEALISDGDDPKHRKGYVAPKRQTSWWNASFILVAELVGTGILGLPSTFSTVGWIPGALLLVVFAGLAFYSGCVRVTYAIHT